jgi:hypothetical protein
MPMAALVIWSVHRLLRFCDTRRRSDLVWFAVLVTASLYAKQLAILMLPVYLVILVAMLGWRALVTRRVALGALGVSVLLLPLAIMTVGLSPANVGIAVSNATRLLSGGRDASVNVILGTIISTHLTLPALLVTLASVVLLIRRRSREVLIGLTWVASVVGGSVVFAGAIEPARYAFGAIPAYFLLTAGLASEARSRSARVGVTAVLAAAVFWQAWTIRDTEPSGAGGYEAAAQYVVQHAGQPSVLYDSTLDTGYFMFFVRKHDPARRLIVLRSDKVLHLDPGEEALVEGRVEWALQTFGVQFVVVEERNHGPVVLRALHQALTTSAFAERARIPIVNNVAADRDLVVYEYLRARPADPDAPLNIGIPLGDRQIGLKMRDLLPPETK